MIVGHTCSLLLLTFCFLVKTIYGKKQNKTLWVLRSPGTDIATSVPLFPLALFFSSTAPLLKCSMQWRLVIGVCLHVGNWWLYELANTGLGNFWSFADGTWGSGFWKEQGALWGIMPYSLPPKEPFTQKNRSGQM